MASLQAITIKHPLHAHFDAVSTQKSHFPMAYEKVLPAETSTLFTSNAWVRHYDGFISCYIGF